MEMKTILAIVEYREYVTVKRGTVPFVRIGLWAATVLQEVCQKQRKDADIEYLGEVQKTLDGAASAQIILCQLSHQFRVKVINAIFLCSSCAVCRPTLI